MKIAAIQTSLQWEDRDANLRLFGEKISALQDTDLIILPEMFSTGFTMNTSLAEAPDGTTFRWMQEQAAAAGIALCGSFIVKEGEKVFNRLHFVHPDGNVQVYDKKHLFALAGEDQHYSPGAGRLVVEYKGWKIGCLVCYDLRFPVFCRRSEAFDYEILLFVANWPDRRIHAWRSLLTARAIENQAYVFGVNRCGNDGHGIAHSGYTMAVDYAGKLLAEASPFMEDIVRAVVMKEELEKFRTALPFWNERDTFRLL